jgi:porin
VQPVDEAGRRLHGRPGFYVIGEKSLYREAADSAQGLTAFMRLGWADPRVNRFTFFAGAGLNYRGLLPGRDDDVLGVAVAVAFNGADYRRAQVRAGRPAERAETNVELTYRAAITSWLTVQPDLQYVIDPDAVTTRPDALAVDLRLVVAF